MATRPILTAEYFDNWYADMVGSQVKDEIEQRHLGLPPHLLSTSLLGWDAIAEVVEGLRLSAGDTLLDLACGRGGYGLEVSARTNARLIGVDFRRGRTPSQRAGHTTRSHGGLPRRRPDRDRPGRRLSQRRALCRRDPVRRGAGGRLPRTAKGSGPRGSSRADVLGIP